MRLIKVITGILVLLPCYLSLAQVNDKLKTHLIILNYSDSVVHANILVNDPSIDPLNNKTYYWYLPDQIYYNQGGYSGNLLHGDYKVFDKMNHLYVQGSYNKGLKSGVWKRWLSNGGLLEVVPWKNGMLDGICLYYNSEGLIMAEYKYRNGKLVQPKRGNNKENQITKNVKTEIDRLSVDSTSVNNLTK
jgi:antitoxin component YwqK of YwqJK toxin-antitoxin module